MPPNRDSYPQRLRPPARVAAKWRRRGTTAKDRGYARRWAEFYKRVVLAAKRQPTWKDEDIYLVGQYVERCRLTELHADEAEANPYPVNEDSKVLKKHPGWEASLAESREARALAAALNLLPSTRQLLGIDVPKIDRPKSQKDEKTEQEQGGGWVDNQRDADGQPL